MSVKTEKKDPIQTAVAVMEQNERHASAERQRPVTEAKATLAPLVEKARETQKELRKLDVQHRPMLNALAERDWRMLQLQYPAAGDLVRRAHHTLLDTFRTLSIATQIDVMARQVEELTLLDLAPGVGIHLKVELALQQAQAAPRAFAEKFEMLTYLLSEIEKRMKARAPESVETATIPEDKNPNTPRSSDIAFDVF